jgi:transcriptional regulator with PAS, ATPase and Fis domain
MHYLLKYHWPGNIRELRNTVERLVVFATDGMINEEHLPFSLSSMPKANSAPFHSNPQNLREERNQNDRKMILHALELENGNKQAAAKRLGISRKTLYNRMHKLNIPIR